MLSQGNISGDEHCHFRGTENLIQVCNISTKQHVDITRRHEISLHVRTRNTHIFIFTFFLKQTYMHKHLLVITVQTNINYFNGFSELIEIRKHVKRSAKIDTSQKYLVFNEVVHPTDFYRCLAIVSGIKKAFLR